MRELCRRDSLHCCDLLGQPIEEVAAVSGRAAKMESGRRPPLDSQYFKRMEAIEFAVKFDDGLGTGLEDADIVLVGVSRTSKTPLSMYLGYLGYKVANVPIVRGIEPPRGAVRDRPREDRRPDDRRRAAVRDPPGAGAPDAAVEERLLGARRDLRGARAGGGDPPAARLSGRRRVGAVDRGDGAARAALVERRKAAAASA